MGKEQEGVGKEGRVTKPKPKGGTEGTVGTGEGQEGKGGTGRPREMWKGIS